MHVAQPWQMELNVWFQLVDAVGTEMTPFKVVFNKTPDVADVMTAVHTLYSSFQLRNCGPYELKVYENKTAFDLKQEYLNPGILITNFGVSYEAPLWIVAPGPFPTAKSVTLSEDTLAAEMKRELVNLKEIVEQTQKTTQKTTLEQFEQLKDTINLTIDTINLTISPLVTDFAKKFYFTSDRITRKRDPKFKENLINYYYGINHAVRSLKCMITGVELPVHLVIGAHLFKSSWSSHCRNILDFENINDSRNGLLLFRPFEFAFDNSHICFVFNNERSVFELKILLPDLYNLTIREYILSQEELDKWMLKSKDEWEKYMNISKKMKNLTQKDKDEYMQVVENLQNLLDKRFVEFEGSPILDGLIERDGIASRCYGRCLTFQATMARLLAIEQRWIEADEMESPSAFSDLENQRKEMITSWANSIEVASGMAKIDLNADIH